MTTIPTIEENPVQVHVGVRDAYRGYTALMGEIETHTLETAEKLRAGLVEATTVPESLQRKKTNALRAGDVNKALEAIREIHDKETLAEQIISGDVAQQAYNDAWEQDAKKIYKAMRDKREQAREEFNALGARFKELWGKHFWHLNDLSTNAIEHLLDAEEKELYQELTVIANTLVAAMYYVDYLETEKIVVCPQGAYTLQANRAVDALAVEPLSAPMVADRNRAGFNISRLVGALSATPKPGTEVEIKWKSNAELKAEAQAFEKMHKEIGNSARVPRSAVEYWKRQAR